MERDLKKSVRIKNQIENILLIIFNYLLGTQLSEYALLI
jgi:hypothetical protein